MWLIVISILVVLAYAQLSYQLYKMDNGVKDMAKEASRQIISLNERLEEAEEKLHIN